MSEVPPEGSEKSVYGVSCQDGSVPGVVKLALTGAVVSLTSVVGGALCLGLGFFPPVAMLSILAIGSAGLVACLVFIISRFGKVPIPDSAPQSSEENAPTPPPVSASSAANPPEIDPVDGEKPPKRAKLSLDCHGTGFHASLRDDKFESVDSQEGDDAAFLEKVEEKFPGVALEFRVALNSVKCLKKLLKHKKLHPYISEVVFRREFEIGNNAVAELFAQVATSFSALRAINIHNSEWAIDDDQHTYTPEVVLAAILQILKKNTLKQVTLHHIHGIDLGEIGPNVDSIFLEDCTNINTKSMRVAKL
jgi:hypothetical protein